MKFHNLEQNTPEWLEFRRTHIGASDAPIIMLGNREALLKRKVQGKETFKTKAMQRGHDLEPIARMMFEEGKGTEYPPAVATHDVLEWASASLDGINVENKKILEIKCCNKEVHEAAKRNEISKEHMIQVQCQLFVTDYDLAYYVHFDGEECAVVAVQRDEALITEIVKACGAFYEELCVALHAINYRDEEFEIVAPILDDEEKNEIMNKILEIREQKKPFKLLCKEEEDWKKKLLDGCPDHNFVVKGVLVHKVNGRVTYDTDQMKMDGIDVEKYKKIGEPSWKIG